MNHQSVWIFIYLQFYLFSFLITSQMTQFKFNSVKAQEESENNFAVKINSAEGTFSTSESTFSRNNTKNCIEVHEGNTEKCPIQKNIDLPPQLSEKYISIEPPQQQGSNRLFTFMDEKEAERRVIYNFINKHKYSHHEENGNCLKEKQNPRIQNIIEVSRKKREEFLNKILGINSNKSNKQIKRPDRMNKSKTSKNGYFIDPPNQNLKNRSKTPRQPQNRSITPKYDKIIRVKSSLQKDFTKTGQKKRQLLHKTSKLTLQHKRQKSKSNITITYEQYKQNNQDQSVKALIKQKKELQRKLSEINESLINCKKKDKGRKKNPIKITAKTNGKKTSARLLI